MSGSNTSATGGYLVEVTPPVEDDPLANLFQSFVVNLTGIDPTLVRPRWQPQPPTQPPVTTDWCAIGVTQFVSTDFPQVVHDSTALGADNMWRLERLEVLASFYGPDSTNNAGILRDGLYVSQNFNTLAAAGIKLRSADDIVHAPELVNAQYISRTDLPMTFMRMVQRTYPVLNVASAVVTITFDDGADSTETIIETLPP